MMSFVKSAPVVAALLLSLAACGEGSPDMNPATSPLSGSGRLEGVTKVVPEFRLAIESYFGTRDVHFEIDKAVRVDNLAFALITVDYQGEEIRSPGWLDLRAGVWQAHDFSFDEGVPPEKLPDPGSDQTSFGPISAMERGAIWGYVDPTFTRVEAVSTSGELLDADAPTHRGGVLILVDESAKELRVFKDGKLVKSIPLGTGGFSRSARY